MPIPDHQEATLVGALHTEYDHSTVVVALWRSLVADIFSLPRVAIPHGSPVSHTVTRHRSLPPFLGQRNGRRESRYR